MEIFPLIFVTFTVLPNEYIQHPFNRPKTKLLIYEKLQKDGDTVDDDTNRIQYI